MKYPLRRVEINIGRAIKALEIDFSRLLKHQQNIEKLKKNRSWADLNDEQIKAWRTVQQLKANVRQLEQLRTQVLDEDVGGFDEKTRDIRQKAVNSTADFLNTLKSAHDLKALAHNAGDEDGAYMEEDDDMVELQQLHKSNTERLHEADDSVLAAREETLQNLENSILELNDLVSEFSSLVHNQGEVVDTIEDNVNLTHENVDQGSKDLSKAAKYSVAAYPLVGALVGTAVGGPVGFVAGLKIGAVAALGGSITGFAGGRLIQKKRKQQIEHDEQERQESRVEPDTT